MTDVVGLAVDALREAGARLDPGLSDSELESLEEKWGISFCTDHAELLRLALPVGDGWIDWRTDPEEVVRARLDTPIDGLLFDVETNDFWPASWGPRPADPAEAITVARGLLESWPRLVPLYGHRYLPSGYIPTPAPVLSVVQSDVVFYGIDLLEWVQREFFGIPLPWRPDRPRIPVWSRLADGCDDCDL